jgi:hypothetical protein
MSRRREKPTNAATVLAHVAQAGCELIRLTGISAAQFPKQDHIPRRVLLDVIAQCTALNAALFEYVSDIEAAAEERERAATPALAAPKPN